jgi:hypothetical protein
MKIGDRVRVVQIPSGLQEGKLKTLTVFKKCLGKIFRVEGFQHDWIELNVGRALGKPSYMEKIWIEPEFLEVVASRPPARKKRRSRAAAKRRKNRAHGASRG